MSSTQVVRLAPSTQPSNSVTPSASIASPPASLYYVHADHLGSPRIITRPGDDQAVWYWDNVDAFGNNAAVEQPSATTPRFQYNLRFPGQYYDQETGMNYNYHRDYDPATGRYIQSDPIGLDGGINTFAYVGGNPLSNIDPEGLDYWIENASETEQKCPEQGCGWHQSFCVGKPYGERFCISFGRTSGQGWCLVDCKGKVYQDRSPVGPIDQASYRTSDSAMDRKIIRRIRPQLGTEGRYDAFGINCRAFTQDLFNSIDREYKGSPSKPPSPPQPTPPKPRPKR